MLGEGLPCPPCNIGPRSTPNYATLEQEAVHALPGGQTVFAGQRNDPFFVDIGSIFDLADLRPFQNLHLIPTAATPGWTRWRRSTCHTIAIQVPITSLTVDGSVPTNVMSSKAVLGVWGSASRRKVRIADGANGEHSEAGPWVQVSRLGNPLFNEVLIPMALKDAWNASQPVDEQRVPVSSCSTRSWRGCCRCSIPSVFPNLEALSRGAREDLVAILLTGLPAGVVPGFQNNTGKVLADMLRLNVAVPPASNPNALGILGGDLAGFPNGRRVIDDVTTIELRAIAGATVPAREQKLQTGRRGGRDHRGHHAAAVPLPGDVPVRRRRRTTGSTSRRARSRGALRRCTAMVTATITAMGRSEENYAAAAAPRARRAGHRR